MPLLELVSTVIRLYTWVVVLSVILSWLVAFRVINTNNRVVYLAGDLLYRLTEPALGRIRRYLPDLGGIDLSPLVLILGLWFFQGMLVRFWPLPF